MALHLVLEDFASPVATARAGSLLNDAAFDVPSLQASGLACVPFNPATMTAPLAGYLSARGPQPLDVSAGGDLTALLIAAGAIGGGAGSPYTPSTPSNWTVPAPTTVGGALDVLAESYVGTYVFRPGDPLGAHARVYTDWGALIVAYNSHAEFPGTIRFDDTFAPIILPANVGNAPWVVLFDMDWLGKHIGATTLVQLADGFCMEGPGGQSGIAMLSHTLSVESLANTLGGGGSGVSPLNIAPGVSDVLVLQYGSTIKALGTQPFSTVAAGGVLIFGIYINPVILTGGAPICEMALGGTAIVYQAAGGTVAPAAFAGDGDLLTILTGATTDIHTQAFEVPGVLGSVSYALGAQAVATAYTPGAVVDWLSPLPTTAQGGLDDLASLLLQPVANPQNGIGGDYSIVTADIGAVIFACAAGAQNIDLPDLSGSLKPGRTLIITIQCTEAATALTVTPGGGMTIDGAGVYTLAVGRSRVSLFSAGGLDWFSGTP